tara:strand:+ start:263 stop:535 length:273 start_codon:yes stop_codon:yes gene_type:complete
MKTFLDMINEAQTPVSELETKGDELVKALNDKIGTGHYLSASPTSLDGFVVKRGKDIIYHIDTNFNLSTNGSGNRRGIGQGNIDKKIKSL